MGSESNSTPKLPLLNIPPNLLPDHSDMPTPPLHTSASVPFRWEEQPGKPRPSTALIPTTLSHQDPNTTGPTTKCLDLPPRLQSLEYPKMTKMPSPTTVLDGPSAGLLLAFRSSSFRFRRERQGSLGSFTVGSPERGLLGDMVLSKRLESKERGLFGSLGRRTTPGRGKKEVGGGGSIVFSPSIDKIEDFCGDGPREKICRMRRNGSFSSMYEPRSHFWETIYEGFKQVLPWKSKKPKKEGFIV
ncbi:uncharacterized protein At4g00950-like [Actinidia eriantha]|uniref:uncharacterized protein At4g00950-like n=1 Tax=Actinidia eriantha TaxID=165200 RepID=UPI002585A98A|nr:uncharacterized protein At4g00950-like [Actinidia eriantha]